MVNSKIKKIIMSVYLVFLLVATGFMGLIMFEETQDEGVANAENIRIVGGTGSGNYSSIQAAINAASLGDTIRVYAGTYYENIVVNKTVSLIGNGSANTTINGNGSGDVIHIIAEGVNVTGFTIMNGTAGVKIDGGNDGRNMITGDGIERTLFLSATSNYAVSSSTQYNNGRRLTTDGGNLYAVYQRYTSISSNYQVFCSRSLNNGTTWQETLVSTGATYSSDNQYYPSIALNGNGVIYVVWSGDISTSGSHDQISFAKSTNGGVSFSTPTLITSIISGDYNFKAVISVDSSNDIHVIWYGHAPSTGSAYNIQYSKSTNGGTTWSAPTLLTSSSTYSSYNPTIAADNNDNVHVAWSGRNSTYSVTDNIFYIKYTTTWGAMETVTNDTSTSYYNYYPCITTDNNNKPHIVFLRKTPSTSNYYQVFHSAKTGSTWSTLSQISTYNYYNYYPSISISRDGIKHVVWYGRTSTSTSNYQIVYSSNSSSSWSTPTALTTGSINHYYPNLLEARPQIVPNNGYAVVYTKPGSVQYDIKYQASADLELGYGSKNNYIHKNKFSDNRIDIYINGSKGNVLTNNTCNSPNEFGVYLHRSVSNSLYNNSMSSCGVFIDGEQKEHWNTHTIPTNNTINGEPLYYWKDLNGGTIPTGAREIILANCTGVTVENQNVSNGSVGIELGFSNNCTITNNTCNSNDNDGIHIYQSNSIIVLNNTCSFNNKNGLFTAGRGRSNRIEIEQDDGIIFYDDFSTDKSWTGYGGTAEWERGPATSGGGDPTNDHSPTSDDYIIGNDIGNRYNNGISGTRWLTSPTIDCTGRTNVKLEFYRWLGIESASCDHAYVAVYNGASWINIWSHSGSSFTDSSWLFRSFDVSTYANNNANFMVRFGLGRTDGSVTYCGWNIDDVEISADPHYIETELFSENICRNNSYRDNICNSNTDNGIFISSSDNSTITDNTCNLNDLNGIHFTTSTNSSISNNTFNSNIANGMYLSEMTENEIVNNTCSDNNGDGIYIHSDISDRSMRNFTLTGDGMEYTVFDSNINDYAYSASVSFNNGRKLTTDGEKLYAVYYRRRSGSSYYQIFCSRSSDNGSSWQETQVSTGSAYSSDYQYYPSIALDCNGVIYVVWDGDTSSSGSYNQISFAKSTDGGVSFSTPTLISSIISGDYNFKAVISVDSSNDIHVIWYGHAPSTGSAYNIQYSKSTNGGTTWSAPTLLTSSSAYSSLNPTIAADNNDNVHVAWQGMTPTYSATNNIFYKKYTNTWGTTEAVTTDASSTYNNDYTCITTDNNNKPHIAWSRRTPSSGTIYLIYHSGKTTSSWSIKTQLSTYTASHNLYASISISSDGTKHVVWQGYTSTSTTNYQIMYACSTGGSWSAPNPLTNDSFNHFYPSLLEARPQVITNRGYAMVYTQPGDIQYDIKLQVSCGFFMGAAKNVLNRIYNNTCSWNRNGIYLNNSDSNALDSNICDMNTDNGIYLFSSYGNTLTDNDCSLNNDNGIFLRDSSWNDIINGNCTFNSQDGIYLLNSGLNSIQNGRFSNNTDNGARLDSSDYIEMFNISVLGNFDNGIVINDSENNTIGNCSLLDNSNVGVNITGGSSNILLVNSTIENSSYADISMDDDSHATLLNTTFDPQKVQYFDVFSNLTVQWFMHVRAINMISGSIANAEIKVWDNKSNLLSFGQTDVQGWCKWFTCTEYVENQSGNSPNLTPHNVSADHLQYEHAFANPEPNMNMSRIVNIVLPYDVTPPNQPTNFTFTAVGRTYLNFTWIASPSMDVQGYNISINNTGSSTNFHFLVSTTDTFYNATDLAEDTIYHFRVRAIDYVFHSSTPIGGYNKTIDFISPEPPLNLIISEVGGTFIKLTWSASTSHDVLGYEVYVNNTGTSTSFHLLELTSKTYHTHTSLSEEITYYYMVKAYDEVPLFSIFSNVNSATTLDITSPSAPDGLTAVDPTGHEITLKWNPNSEADIFGYHIFINDSGVGSSGPFHWIATVPTTSTQFTVQDLTEETSYYFVITAFDEVPNNSTYSNITAAATLDVTPPESPTGLKAIPKTGTKIHLTWNSNSETDLAGYHIYMNNSDKGPDRKFKLISSIIGLGTSYKVTGLLEEVTYYFKLKAFDEVPNNSSYSDEVFATTFDTTPPNAPKGLMVSSPTHDSLTITWLKNPETDVKGYYLYRSLSRTGKFVEINSAMITDTKFIDTDLNENTVYYYKLKALDEVPQQSAFSDVAFGVTIYSPNKPKINNSINDFEILEDTCDDKSINLYYWFKDINGDTLKFRCQGQVHIKVSIYQNNGTVILVPEQNWNGRETLTFYADDGISGEISDVVTITILPVNDPPEEPVFVSPNGDIRITDGVAINFEALCNDPDLPYGDELTFSWSSDLTGELGKGENLSGILLLLGYHTITLEVSDSAGESSLAIVKAYILNSSIIDTDGDSILDKWEIENDLNPYDPSDAKDDPDLDGLTNIDEFMINTDPNNMDTDGDGLSDGDEFKIHKTNPTKPDSDDDGYNDSLDAFPLDNTKWKKSGKSVEKGSDSILLLVGVALLIVLIFSAIFIRKKQKPNPQQQLQLQPQPEPLLIPELESSPTLSLQSQSRSQRSVPFGQQQVLPYSSMNNIPSHNQNQILSYQLPPHQQVQSQTQQQYQQQYQY